MLIIASPNNSTALSSKSRCPPPFRSQARANVSHCLPPFSSQARAIVRLLAAQQEPLFATL